MKKNIGSAFVLAAFLLVANLTSSGQKPQDRVYLILFYVKPLPGMQHEYVNAEWEVFKPGHQAAVNAGNLISWSVFWVETSSDFIRDYDFVVVRAYKNIEDLDAVTPDSFYVETPSGVNMDSLRLVGFKTRESPRREIWVVDKEHAKELTGQFDAARMLVNFNSKPLSDSSLYTPLVKDSTIKHWESYSLLIPQSDKYPYQFLSIYPFEQYKSLPAILNKTRPPSPASKSIVKQEMWSRWAGTDLKKD